MNSAVASRLSWGLILSSIDFLACLLFTCLHDGTFKFANFTGQFSDFSFFTRFVFWVTIDLFLLQILRFALWMVPAAIHMANKADTLTMWKEPIFCTSLLICAASPTKLLLLTEKLKPGEFLTFGDTAFLVWNFLAAIILNSSWTRFFIRTPSSYIILEDEDVSSVGVSRCPDVRIFQMEQAPKQTFELIFRLLQYCKREWLWHISGFSWLFIYSITRIFVPYYTGQVIATVVATKSYPALSNAVYIMTIISLVSAVAAGFRGGSFEYAYARIQRSIRYDLFHGLVKQDVAFYDAHKTGEITSRLAADCQTMSDTVALNVNVFLRNCVMLLGSMIFMMKLSWRLSLVTFILVPIIFVASKIFGTYYDLLSERTQDTIAESNDVAEEVLSTMRTVRSFACENVEADRFYGKLTHTLDVTRTKAIAYIGFLWVSELFQSFIIVAVLWYGGHLVLTQKMKADLLVSFLLYQMQLGDNLRQMGEVWTGLMQSVGASRKVFEYIDREPQIQHLGEYMPENVVGKIEFRNVHFSYPTRSDQPILKSFESETSRHQELFETLRFGLENSRNLPKLKNSSSRDLSFTVEPGETVALVGPSGSGKSSCISLLENFYIPNAGQVLVDGVPLEDYEHHYIHKKIALVGQEPVLFARSVMENVRYGVEVADTDVIRSCEMANAHGFIMQTTLKYETNVGEKGTQMSGGQKQRIAIARALVREPAILLLDEATSALDTESEHVVQEAIYKNLDGKSVILIAHRLSTVEKADKIVVINKGRVEQIGNHESLLKDTEGTYAKLVKRQMMGDQKPRKRTTVPRSGPQPATSINVAGPSQGNAMSLLSTSFSQSASSVTSH
ncbi:Protein CBR-HAF-4 [Caenorhabditis briggsae]|uniref:Protein CBR-HAF-4 n=1 Tax=Caenorhabditis briggsae TaxID=6238 RepID=A8Y2T8_CAEBR|nr:Protein CBR-HAF-4 [Caenorhabditis briggsae]CAP39213.2 Protein CBR-HAF-4 [Caenorhabditis briggsae]